MLVYLSERAPIWQALEASLRLLLHRRLRNPRFHPSIALDDLPVFSCSHSSGLVLSWLKRAVLSLSRGSPLLS